MERISFINQQFLPHSQCFVHIEDRGFQFADGVYEVILFKNNKLIDIDWHLERLSRSLSELNIRFDQNSDYLKEIILELFAKNNLSDGSVYLQITRGTNPRQPTFPSSYTPTIVATVLPLKNLDDKNLTVITHPDIRWQRCDIKSVSLLASSWILQKAADSGNDDSILIRDGFITEATFANVFIVDNQDNLITRNADNLMLQGITRNRIIDLANKNGIVVLEKKFRVEELFGAKEVFLSSTTLMVRPVSRVDGQIIGNGEVGNITQKLSNLYNDFINN